MAIRLNLRVLLFGSIFSVIVTIIATGLIIGAVCWPYAINTWLEFCSKNPRIVWWQGMLIGIVPGIGHIGLVLAIVTWIAMLFLK
jgi:hypothetical protein